MLVSKFGKALGVAALALLVSVAVFGSSAQAVNPAIWDDLFVETLGADAFWDSATNVDTGFPLYDSSFEVGVAVQLGGVLWLNADNLFGDAIVPGPLPIAFINENVVFDPPGEDPSFFDILLEVDAAGQGHLSVTNPIFGTFAGGNQITGVRLGGLGIANEPTFGNLTVEGIPEPSSLALLGLAVTSLAAVRRRRR